MNKGVKEMTPFEIFKAGVQIFKNLNKDACSDELEEIKKDRTTYDVDNLETKIFGPGIYITSSSQCDGLPYQIVNSYEEEEKDIEDILKPSNKRLIDLTHGDSYKKLSKDNKLIFDEFIKMHWEYKEVHCQGTEHESSGYGSDYQVVYYFPTYDLYIRFDGYYSSYEGAVYRSFKEARPQEKKVIVYE